MSLVAGMLLKIGQRLPLVASCHVQRRMSTMCCHPRLLSCLLSTQTAPSQHHNLLQNRASQPLWVPTASLFLKSDIDKMPKNDPEKGKLVYVGVIAPAIKLVKTFSVSTSIFGLALQPFIYSTMASTQQLPLTLAICGTIASFIFVTPLLLHWVTKRYVTELYHHPDTGVFTATTYTLFVRRQQHTFHATDVTVPSITGIFTTFLVNGKPLFVDPSTFMDNDVFVKLMRYDEPLDWEMPPSGERKGPGK